MVRTRRRFERAGRLGVVLATFVAGGTFPAAAQAPAVDADTVSRPASPAPLRPIHDFGGAVVDFGRDFWEVLPTGYDRDRAVRLAGVLAVGAVLFVLDDEITGRLREHEPGTLRRGIREVGDTFAPLGMMGNTNVYYAATAATAYLLRFERIQLAAKELLFSHWIAGLTRKSVGRLVGRRRPDEGADATTFDVGEGTSFPSGHTSTIFQVAHVLSHHIDRAPVTVALYGIAGTVAFQRLDAESHWASDVWIGAAWGLAVSHAVVGREERDRMGVVIAPAPSGGLSLGVGLRH